MNESEKITEKETNDTIKKPFRFSVLLIVLSLVISFFCYINVSQREREYMASQNITNALSGFERAYGYGKTSEKTQEKLDELSAEKKGIDQSKTNIWIFLGISFLASLFLFNLENMQYSAKTKAPQDIHSKLSELNRLKEDGLISDAQFNEKQQELLKKL